MNFIRNTILCLAISTAVCALSGCEQPGDQNRGTYTAARHMRTGSNLPQANDADSTGSVYAPPTQSSSISGAGNGAAGGMNSGLGSGGR